MPDENDEGAAAISTVLSGRFNCLVINDFMDTKGDLWVGRR
jgi:hypothetical protein